MSEEQGAFSFWRLNPAEYKLEAGGGYYIDLQDLVTQKEWNHWLKHLSRKVDVPSPEPAFLVLFPNGPLKTAAAVRKRVDAYADRLKVPVPSAVLRGLTGFADVAVEEGRHKRNADSLAALKWLKRHAGWRPET